MQKVGLEAWAGSTGDIPPHLTPRPVLNCSHWTHHALEFTHPSPQVEVMPIVLLPIDEDKHIKIILPPNAQLSYSAALGSPSARHLTHFCFIPTSGAVCCPSSHMPPLFSCHIGFTSHSWWKLLFVKTEAAAFNDRNLLISLSDLTWKSLDHAVNLAFSGRAAGKLVVALKDGCWYSCLSQGRKVFVEVCFFF